MIRDEMNNSANADMNLQIEDCPATCTPLSEFQQISEEDLKGVVLKFSNSCFIDFTC